MFELCDVCFSYPGAKEPALRHVGFRLAPNRTTAVLGLSGSGKTTLLSLMGLLWDGAIQGQVVCYRDDKGRPHDYLSRNGFRRSDLRLHEFGFVMQSSYMLPHFSCMENIGMPLALQQVDQRHVRVEELLQTADPSRALFNLRGRLPRDISGGERQRMAVLRAVVHDPRVLFADEPLSSLDPLNARCIIDLLKRWKSGGLQRTERKTRSLVLVSHNIEIACEMADDIIVLKDGRLVGEQVWPRSALNGPQQVQKMMFEGTP